MTIPFRTYRVPLAASALIVVALAFWAWQDWRSFGEHVQERERHRAIDLSWVLTGAIHSMAENERLKREEIEGIVEHIIRDSPYQFLVLEQNGRRILQAGDLPAALTLPSAESESFEGGFYLLSRKVHLHGDEGWKDALDPRVSELTGSGIGSGEQLMILGGAVRDHGHPKALAHMLIPLAIALLLLTMKSGICRSNCSPHCCAPSRPIASLPSAAIRK